MSQNKWNKTHKRIFIILSVALIAFIIAVSFIHAMQQPYDHDENQYITGGKLLADQNLVPYLDYRYFHMPNIIFINAFVFRITDYLLLGARSVNVIAFSLIIIMIYFISIKYFKQFNYLVKLLVFLAAVNLLIGNPIVQYSTGKAWTYDIPLMLLILAFLLHLIGTRSLKPNKWFFINGLLIGLATGTRLSYLFTIFPFVIGFLLLPELKIKLKFKFITIFFCGFVVAMLPSIILFLAAPGDFFYDIYTFHTKVDSLYLISRGHYLSLREMFGTLFFFSNNPNNIVLIIGIIFLLVIKIFYSLKQKASGYSITLILIILLFLFISSLIKNVFFKQYLFNLVPFIIIGFLLGISVLKNNYKRIAIFLFLILSLSFSNKKIYSEIENLFSPEKWLTYKTHNFGKKITNLTTDNYVLTLTPLFVLEGGGKIYKEFANNPFNWRTSHFVPKKTRNKFNIISPEELNAFLSRKPPYGVLIGFEGEFDEIFLKYAMDNNYIEEKIPRGRLFIIQQK